jgi:hypothetical protein
VRRSGGLGTQRFATDVNLTPPKVDEVSAGMHRQILDEAAVGVDYTYRHYGNLWVNEEVNQIWDPAGTRIVGYVNGERQRLLVATPQVKPSASITGWTCGCAATPATGTSWRRTRSRS